MSNYLNFLSLQESKSVFYSILILLGLPKEKLSFSNLQSHLSYDIIPIYILWYINKACSLKIFIIWKFSPWQWLTKLHCLQLWNVFNFWKLLQLTLSNSINSRILILQYLNWNVNSWITLDAFKYEYYGLQ